MSAFGIVTIGLTAAWGTISILATFVWRFFASIFEVVQALVMSLLSNKALVIIPALAFIFGVGFAATYEQPFIMENVDTIYSCYVLPTAEVTFSILHTMIAEPYHYMAHGFNQIYPSILAVFHFYIDSVKLLGAPGDEIVWYQQFVNNTYFLVRNIFFLWAYAPSWQLPFGFSAFLVSWAEITWCWSADISEAFAVENIGFSLFNAYCPYCDYDPDATCILRQKFFPQAPDPPNATCAGCRNFPCIPIYCVFRFFNNVTAPLQIALGIDLSMRINDMADDVCCILSQSFPPLFFIVVGISDNLAATDLCLFPSDECSMVSVCGNAANLTHFVVFTWLNQLASCLNKFVEDATFGYIDDILVLLFEALLPVIQVLVAGVECTANSTFVSCLEAYPGSCAVNSDLVPTDGLFVCADIWGECVLDNAPVIDLEPFITLLTSTIPTIVQFSIDLFTCNFYVALTVCFTNDAILACNPATGPAFFTCVGDCLGGTPLGYSYNSFVDAFWEVVNSVCSVIQIPCTALSISCPCNFPILDAIKTASPRIYPNQSITQKYLSQIDPDLFCGNVILTWKVDTDWRKQENWGSYTIHELCMNFFNTGINRIESNEMRAFEMNVTINDFITPYRFLGASQKLETVDYTAHANKTKNKRQPPQLSFEFVKKMAQVRSTLSSSPYYNLVLKYTRERDALYSRFNGDTTTVTMWDGTAVTADLSDQNNAFEKAAYMRGLGEAEEFLKMSFLDALRDLNKKNRMPIPWHSRRNPGLHGRTGPPPADKSPADALAEFNARRKSDPRRDYEAQIGRYEPTYRTYTKEELAKSHEMVDTALSHARGIIEPAARMVALLNHDGGLPERAARYFNADHWDSYQKAHMLLHVVSTEAGVAYGDYLGGKTSYLAEEGFVSHERYHQVMDEKKASDPPPQYDANSTRAYGPFFTDPHAKWFPSLSELFARNRALVEGAHARRVAKLEAMGYNTTGMSDMDAILAFDASGSFGNGIQTVFGILEYFINNVFGTLTDILFGIKLDINLNKTGQKIIDFFTGRTITIDTLKKVGSDTQDFLTCHYPQDVDGTKIFNPFCFPCVPEDALSWMRTIPNAIFPMQIPWPKELIAQDCVTPFNGRGNLFYFRKSNVCPTPDIYTRPFCPTCDVCMREYNECLHISTVNSPLKTLFFTTGAIPVLADDFLNGGIAADQLFPFVVAFSIIFMLAMAPSVGFGPQLLVLPLVFFIPLFVYYAMVKTFSSFAKHHGGSGMIIPYGFIYLLILIFVGIFFSSAVNLASGFGIFLQLFAALWILNLFVPLKPFQSVFNINHYAHNFFWAIDNGPSPLKYVDWSSFVHYTELYDFEKNPIRSVDITCYFWTWGNAVILIVTAYLMFWFVYWLYLVLLAIALMVLNLALLVFVTYRAVKQWSFNMKTVNSAELIEEMQEDMKRTAARLKLHDSFIARLDPSFLRIRSESYFSAVKAPPKWRVVYPPIGQPYLERGRPKTKEL